VIGATRRIRAASDFVRRRLLAVATSFIDSISPRYLRFSLKVKSHHGLP
jgi:hypothetical protein